jgi:biopolymer transport protein ExbD
MRKCSRVVHNSLTGLNITPLLDLAFVLLVIFIITTTPMVNDLVLHLPTASSHPKDALRKANYVTVEASGVIYLNKKRVGLEGLRAELVQLRMDDPDLNVVVRGDGRTKYRQIVRVMDVLQQANVVKVEVATEAAALGEK